MLTTFHKIALAASIATAGLAATPAMAATTVVGPYSGCPTAPLSPAADKCYGYISNNQFSSSNVSTQQAAIDALIGAGNYTVNWTDLVNAGLVVSGNDAAGLQALANLLASAGGQVILGFHWGNVPDNPDVYGNVSAVYLWNNVTPGSISLTNFSGYSNAVLYRSTQSAVPEPATWALMLAGFGAVGYGMRRRRRTSPALLQLA